MFTVLLAGGGTAGHIEPALAVGEACALRHGAHVEALGTPKGLESQIVPARGVELHVIDPVPIPRKKPWKLLGVPFKLIRSVYQARSVIKRTKTDVVFGTGGYVSASAYLAAWSTRTPFFVLETNALAGMANKLGVRLGGKGINAVPHSGMKGEVIGIPVRSGLGTQLSDAEGAAIREQFGLLDNRPTLLVTGGSQGAASINAALADAIPVLVDHGWQILHAYGPKNQPAGEHEHYHPVPYIEEMPKAYAVSDAIVCRSGAMTVAEVSAAELPALYVPLPHGNGEQGKNSAHVVAAGGALTIADSELSGTTLIDSVEKLKEQAPAMRKALAHSGAGNAANNIADRIAKEVSRA